MRPSTMLWGCRWCGSSVPGKVLRNLRLASVLSPDDAHYIYVYAVALNSTGKQEEAIMVLQGAHNRHPNNRDILSALVAFLRDMGNEAAASDLCREAARAVTLMLPGAESSSINHDLGLVLLFSAYPGFLARSSAFECGYRCNIRKAL